jgi:succinoglycan biosynthesis transport protein ExoP
MDGSLTGATETAAGTAPKGLRNNIPEFFRDQFDLRQMVAILRRRRAIVLVCIAVVTLLATFIVYQLKPRYTADATLLLDTRKTNVIDLQAVMSGIQPEAFAIRSEVDVLRSRQLAQKVVEKLGLAGNPVFNTDLRQDQESWIEWLGDRWDRLTEWLGGLIPGSRPPPPTRAASEHERTVTRLTDRLLDHLGVVTDGRSYTIHLSYTSEDPQLATDIVNTVADLYLVDQLEAKFDATRRANNWLSDRLNELRNSVETAERAVQAYREQHKLAVSDARGTSVTTQQLGELNTQLVMAGAERAQKEARLHQFQQAAKAGTLPANEPEVLSSPLIQRLREQETDILRKDAELSTHYGARHPAIINVRAELRDVRHKIEEEINKIVGNLAQDVQISRIREGSLQQNLADLQQKANQNNVAEVQLHQLDREAQANRTLYESFLTRFKETSEQENIQQADARIIARADVPIGPSFPNKRLLITLALLGSAMVGVFLAVLVERMDNGFRTGEQLETIAGVAGLGMVPAVPARSRIGITPEDYVLRKPNSAYAESIRSIRAAILYSHVDRPPRALLVTSAVPDEGKSILSLSMARSAAKAGQRVLLIDTDMRRPRLSKVLGGPTDATLAEVFAGSKNVQDIVRVEEESGLHYILGRAGMPNPQDMLGSQHMRDFVRSMSQHYDLVILDSPPVLAASDALVLSRIVDATVFVVRWERTPRPIVLGALKQIHSAGGVVAGAVLTRVNVKKHARFGYGDHGYYYGRYREYHT